MLYPESDAERDSRSGFYRARLAGRAAQILVAEDDVEMRKLLTERLRREGFEVIEARNGVELIDLISDQILHAGGDRPLIDLIISDVRMPGLTGLEALSGLRAGDWSTPFIVITAFGDDDTHAEAHRLGACAVFDKPFDFDDLCTAVINRLRP